jgi:hypothetical protein
MAWIIIVLIILAVIAWGARARRDRSSQGYPYIPGTGYYRRSLEHRYSTVAMRLSQGLPLTTTSRCGGTRPKSTAAAGDPARRRYERCVLLFATGSMACCALWG